MSAATLYRAGTVHSDADPFATALLVSGGVIAWLGDEEGADVQARVGGDDLVVVDLAGALLAPGFVDAVGQAPVADPAALAAMGIAARLDETSRSPWARVVRSEAELDALAPGTVACLDPVGLGDVDLAARAAAGVPLALGLADDAAGGPWRRVQHALAAGLSARAAFVAHTRGAWRASSRPDGPTLGRLHVGSPATFAVWDADELVTQAADARRSAWSLDSRSGVPPLPRLGAVTDLTWEPPRCVSTVVDGVAILAGRL
ncbi:hypothetical protein C8046_02320 [Serinibacter arcticus]|uniref:Exoenzymes regulatory protein AepA in lipid-linked oligosaccharide synthesis cluster n=1 Tax=Serinibacter arcticus TaxID=1655435 RepID=A0A2U1ZRX7_9MICO|nr:hypothetical protein [Serinibacter arcticus]PWD49711.1 hypothetical protein C8046_02320 [Serinibacter arcticus]